jgi:sec-independent protein translocase protein TatB
MFDFSFPEIALIGVVALIAIGPKDMPVAIKAISDTVKKLRRMAGEFQGHVDEMIRDADLGEVKSTFDELRSMNLKNTIHRAIDPDGMVRTAFTDPFKDRRVPPVMAPLDQPHIAAGQPVPALPLPDEAAGLEPPAFIPPGAAPPVSLPPAPPAPPAFIPPQAAPPAPETPLADAAQGH